MAVMTLFHDCVLNLCCDVSMTQIFWKSTLRSWLPPPYCWFFPLL